MIRNHRIFIMLCLLLGAVLVLVSCSNPNTDSTSNSESLNAEVPENGAGSNLEIPDDSNLRIVYQYTDQPVTDLKSFLKNDIKNRSLPMEIGDVVERSEQEHKEFGIQFTNENAGVVSFSTGTAFSMYYHDSSLDGEKNPSFTIAFKDPNKPQDMVAVMTSVILYLSPDLRVEEAERLAKKLDDTISIDGYSIPQDIGGYQIQSHYTNPHVYFTTEDFESSLCVTVTALKQIWSADLDAGQCRKLTTAADFKEFIEPHNSWEKEEDANTSVYADIIVKDWWQYQEAIHYEITTWVDVVSPTGDLYQFRLDTMRTPYEFGIGEKYTLFIARNSYGPFIFHAVQLTD